MVFNDLGWAGVGERQPVEAAARLGFCQFEILRFVKPSPKGQCSVTEKEIVDKEIKVTSVMEALGDDCQRSARGWQFRQAEVE